MNRYSFAEITNRWDGKRVYKSIIYPPIPVRNDDTYIITNEISFFDTLAKKYYNDTSLWWVIAQANNMCNGKLSAAPGVQLRIPGNIISVLNELKIVNS